MKYSLINLSFSDWRSYMFNPKTLSALSYVSILFAPFLLPIILFFVTKEKEVKYHAKRASISHLIPTVLGAAISIFALMSLFTFNGAVNGAVYNPSYFTNFMIWMFIYFIISSAIVVWNLIQAVRVFRQNTYVQ